MKNKICTYFILSAIILTACTNKTPTERTLYYKTDQYLIYQRFSTAIAVNSEEHAFLYTRDISGQGKDYYAYGTGELQMWIEKRDLEKRETDYLIIKEGIEIARFTLSNIFYSPIEISMIYADITKDGKNDIIIKGGSASGAPVCWSYAYDLKNGEEISFFAKTGYPATLTEKQMNQLVTLLEKDSEFQKLFPDYEYLGRSGEPFVDHAGNVYYELGIMKPYDNALGKLFLLMVYNQEEKCFDIADYLYTPTYVEVPVDGD